MSSWGNTDNVVLTGTVTTANTTNTVTGFGTTYTGNVNAGDYVFIDSNKYQVEQVVSASVLYVTTSNVATNSDNVNAYVQAGPKYVTNVVLSSSETGNAEFRADNLTTIQNVFGVDITEMTPNIVIGLSLLETTLVSSATITEPGNYILDSQTNTIVTITTTGTVQPTENALATPTFTGNALTGVTITREGVGYTADAQANTTAVVSTTGEVQPTVNATISLNYIAGDVTGLGYDSNAQANTTVTISTLGLSQPTENATATLSYTGERVSGFTVTNRGTGYTAAAQANTSASISTSGAVQPTGNAQATVDYSSTGTGALANSTHTGWVVRIPTYTDALGQPRTKYETLVAMSKNFNTDSAGTLQVDASDDTEYPQ